MFFSRDFASFYEVAPYTRTDSMVVWKKVIFRFAGKEDFHIISKLFKAAPVDLISASPYVDSMLLPRQVESYTALIFSFLNDFLMETKWFWL